MRRKQDFLDVNILCGFHSNNICLFLLRCVSADRRREVSIQFGKKVLENWIGIYICNNH